MASSRILPLVFPLLLGFGVSFLPGQELRKEEKNDYYQKWLSEDVLYIITPEEKAVFQSLQTDEEREQFIEQFWRRRDPDPRTAVNEFKEEHYRRIAYANENFTSGFPGWKTDRGMIYIKFGPPDRREINPTGGHYTRPSWEGGGSTSTYPFERWEYRYIEGVGQDIEIEFVDDTLSGEYRLTTNPHDKDALLRIPNAGLTDAEMLGLVEQKIDRIVPKTSPMPGHNPLLAGYGRAKDQPFEKLELVTNLQKAPSIAFTDLKTRVLTEIHYEQVPLQVRSDSFRLSDQESRVIVSLFVRSGDLNFRREGESYLAELDIYGVLTNLGGQIVADLEETLVHRVAAADYGADSTTWLTHQKDFHLTPGRYKLELIVKDRVGDRLGSTQSLVLVPTSPREGLQLSSVLLAQRIEAHADEVSGNQRFRIWPAPGNRLSLALGKLGFYYEVYGLQVDQSDQKPRLELTHRILDGNGEEHRRQPAFSSIEQNQDRVSVLVLLPMQNLSPGKYRLQVEATDHISGHSRQVEIPFELF